MKKALAILNQKIINGLLMLIYIMEIISFKKFYFRKSIQIYDEMMREKDYNKDYHVYKVIFIYK